MAYSCVTTLDDLRAYLENAPVAAFDFETAPDDPYRDEERAALDAHKAHIVGISFSVESGSAIYVPLAHRVGINAEAQDALWAWLEAAFFGNRMVTKIAHNLSFEAMYLYARGIILQPPYYDTIAASQLTLKDYNLFRALGDSGLKTLVPALLGDELPSFTEVTGGRAFGDLDAQDAETVRYACADSDYTLRLYDLFNRWFDRYLPKHRRIVETVESPTAVYVPIKAEAAYGPRFGELEEMEV